MALIKYNQNNIDTTRKGEVSIRINRKAAISISKAAAELTGFQPGDSIGLLQDDETADWYLIKDPDGFTLRDTGKTGSLSFNSTALANMILESAELPENSYKFKIAREPIATEEHGPAWCIIIASAI